jgi:hypothetical protein
MIAIIASSDELFDWSNLFARVANKIFGEALFCTRMMPSIFHIF